jgi:hypothetical protein
VIGRKRNLVSAISIGWSASAILLVIADQFALAIVCLVVGCVTAYAVARDGW